jgi:hypothetical protein
VIDGVTVATNDRVLVYEQTDQTQNGVYVVTSTGSGSTNWVLTRSADADSYVINDANGLSEGSTVFVQQGTTGAGETYTCNTSGVITFGTTAIVFAQISSAQVYSAGSGLALTGTVFSNTAPDQTVTLTQGGATTISGTYPNFTITSVNTTYSAGNGIGLAGTTFSVAAGSGLTQDASGLSHADTSSQSSVDNSGATFVQDVTLDTFGHVTGLTSVTATPSLIGAPSTTGVGASGSWGISVTGTAGNVTGTVAIANGGTGATTAGQALNNLGLTATATELNYTSGVTSAIQTQLDAKAPLASPALSGTPTAPTASVGTDTTQIATTAFVNAEIANDAPTKTGVGASGTWNIAISGNAATATSATTSTSTTNPTFSGDSVSKADITTRTDSGFYETDTGTTAEGWPRNDGAWQHMIASTHSNDSNYYSMQLAGGFYSQQWYMRNTNGNGSTSWSELLTSASYNSYAPSLTGTGASGNWAINVTGNAATTSQRAFSGDISTTGQGRFTGWYSGGAATGAATEVGVSGGESYILGYNRDTSTYIPLNISASGANMYFNGSAINVTSGALQQGGNQVLHAGNYNSYAPTLTGTGASGNWGINVTGNAATVTNGVYTSDNVVVSRGSLGDPADWNAITTAGVYTVAAGSLTGANNPGGYPYGTLYVFTDGARVTQFYTRHSSTSQTSVRNKFNVSDWQPWANLLSALDYTSYAPSLTGSGASGTWNIDISGNAATASNATAATLSVIQDTRSGALTPNDYSDYRVTYEFTNQVIGGDWHSAITPKGWSDGYAAWQIWGPSSTSAHENWYLRSGVNTTWNPLRTILHSGNYTSYAPSLTGSGASGTWGINVTGNAATATSLSTDRTNWSTNGTIDDVVGQLAWKNYGNNHTIFDASNSTSPSGSGVNNTNADIGWAASYPTLMGWNGVNTYGVRVDSARVSDSAGSVAWGNVSSKPSNIMYYQGFTLDANTMDSNSTGFTYSINAPATGPVARFSTGGSYDLWLNAPYSGGGNNLYFRTRNGDTNTLNSWRTVLNDANYTSYAPSLTGSGASGTWGINISGTAATDTSRAPLASPALTGTPTAPTASVGTNTTQIATTAFVLANGGITRGTAVTASGTSVNFTGIPAGVNRVTLMFAGVSTNGSSSITVQLGTSSGLESSGYLGSISTIGTGAANGPAISYFIICQNNTPASVYHGSMILSRLNGNVWVQQSIVTRSDANSVNVLAGSKSLGAVLDRISISTVIGNSFDAGTINIMYE